MDLTRAIEPKSDQLNADDLIAGSRVITITEVKQGNAEQPVVIHFEGDDGKPWKPCKSMIRVMVKGWGTTNASELVGKSVELYCDPKVRWGGVEVGGIRIKAMSHIESGFKMSLTATRGQRRPYSVELLRMTATEIQDRNNIGLVDTLQAKFEACQTMDALRDAWESVPSALKKEVEPHKDAAKARLQGVAQ